MSGAVAIFAGAIAAFLAVALGAFGAHALAHRLTDHGAALWQTAERYQLVHALALLAVGLLWERLPRGPLLATGLLFVSGIVLFSGSLYVLALGAPRWTGFITPVGGIALLSGWITLAAGALSRF